MSRLKNLISIFNSTSIISKKNNIIASNHPSQRTNTRSLDVFEMANKAVIERKRARLADELNRGFFADIREMEKHGGKVSKANKVVIPAMQAVKFPTFEADYSNSLSLKLPIMPTDTGVNEDVPKATLMCLYFRPSGQAMVNSWSKPFSDAFKDSRNIHIYEVSLTDKWYLTTQPIKWLLLRSLRKSNPDEGKDGLQRQILYSFGDHYYFRKELKILNLCTGYFFLLDNFGRIRWQGTGRATDEEVQSLLSCTSVLLQEVRQ